MATEPSDPPSSERITVRDFEPQPQYRSFEGRVIVQELVRTLVTLILLVIFGGTIYLTYQNLGGTNFTNARDLLQALLPAETGLLGTALGFYFGSRSRDS